MSVFLKYLSVFGLSMVPVSELRGAIPLGILLYDFDWLLCYILCCIGNFLPVPFVLFFIERIIDWSKTTKHFARFGLFLERKAAKNADKVNRYGFFGLMLFIAIPLPMTGAWTGTLVAALTGMKPKRALLSCLFGILIAGAIVTLICTGPLSFLSWMLGDKMN